MHTVALESCIFVESSLGKNVEQGTDAAECASSCRYASFGSDPAQRNGPNALVTAGPCMTGDPA